MMQPRNSSTRFLSGKCGIRTAQACVTQAIAKNRKTYRQFHHPRKKIEKITIEMRRRSFFRLRKGHSAKKSAKNTMNSKELKVMNRFRLTANRGGSQNLDSIDYQRYLCYFLLISHPQPGFLQPRLDQLPRAKSQHQAHGTIVGYSVELFLSKRPSKLC